MLQLNKAPPVSFHLWCIVGLSEDAAMHILLTDAQQRVMLYSRL